MTKHPVLVLPKQVVDDWIVGPGFIPAEKLQPLERLLSVPGFHFHPRHQAEEDENWQQVIPYLVVRSPSGWFRYRRGKAGSESRLHALWSCGVGGHVEPVDGTLLDPQAAYRTGMVRELREELGVESFQDRFLGLIRDPSNPVGRVHLGFVHLVTVPGDVSSAEEALQEGTHGPASEIRTLAGSMETWSRLVIEAAGDPMGLDSEFAMLG